MHLVDALGGALDRRGVADDLVNYRRKRVRLNPRAAAP
jgi:hypothetical protein